jgi:(R)-2-hydroxyacyl-CoA dehydratese activating ATPase
MVSAGIDVGSRTIKIVVLDDGAVVRRDVVEATSRPRDCALSLMSSLPSCPIVATGYGRDMLDVERQVPTITEIKAHALGARYFFPTCTGVIDIGGQDLKIVALDTNGKIARFEMNDRCAAGTGKFLEVMAHQLGYSLDEFGPAALRGREGVTINAMCTVFAESEVIGLVNRDHPREDVARALHNSVARKISAMYGRLDADESRMVLSGGGARNPAIVNILRRELGVTISVPDDPRIVGAVGCAIEAAGR